MKKNYIKPAVYMQNVEIESLLAAESGGSITEGEAKRNDFWTNEDEAQDDKLSFNSVWE